MAGCFDTRSALYLTASGELSALRKIAGNKSMRTYVRCGKTQVIDWAAVQAYHRCRARLRRVPEAVRVLAYGVDQSDPARRLDRVSTRPFRATGAGSMIGLPFSAITMTGTRYRKCRSTFRLLRRRPGRRPSSAASSAAATLGPPTDRHPLRKSKSRRTIKQHLLGGWYTRKSLRLVRHERVEGEAPIASKSTTSTASGTTIGWKIFGCSARTVTVKPTLRSRNQKIEYVDPGSSNGRTAVSDIADRWFESMPGSITALSSRGLGRRPLTAVTRVRIPLGLPKKERPFAIRVFHFLCATFKTLDDLLKRNLDVVFVGINPSIYSVEAATISRAREIASGRVSRVQSSAKARAKLCTPES